MGTHSALGERSHTAAHTAKHGAFQMGGGIITLGALRTFANLPGPGIRTAYFAALGTWPGAFSENAESLRDSDALMCVAVPRRRGPAGLRDLFSFLSKLRFVHPAHRHGSGSTFKCAVYRQPLGT